MAQAAALWASWRHSPPRPGPRPDRKGGAAWGPSASALPRRQVSSFPSQICLPRVSGTPDLRGDSMTHPYDVASLGNAIVDIIASVDDRFLLNHRIAKGTMTLIDEFRAKELLKALADNQQTMSSLHEVAGGSAANTMAGLASLGGKGLFLGK